MGDHNLHVATRRERERERDMKKRVINGVYTYAAVILTTLQVMIRTQTVLVESAGQPEVAPTPLMWPDRFHALLYMNLSSTKLQITNLWYDWPKGRNVNLIQKQLGVLLYDVEWNNGTTFYYTLGADGTCRTMQNDVGIPRRDFLDGADYLGTAVTDGFLCNVWEKVDTIWYYEDVLTKRPVRWDFYDGISTHVITFEVGAILPDSMTQAPAYCFSQEDKDHLRIFES